ncbi:MAG: hypothetical protein RMJ66_06660 [Bacteroidia bacterium]|nr:hypothetical protein [Bacteroidia bacterium]MDW8134733.1 hypothetical protein [Bacteroidia bacterium]
MAIWKNWLRTFLPWGKASGGGSTVLVEKSDGEGRHFVSSIDSDEYVLAPIKQWVISTLSPYAWDRVVIRSIRFIRDINIPLTSLLSPHPDTKVPREVVHRLSAILREMYGRELPLHEVFKNQIVV